MVHIFQQLWKPLRMLTFLITVKDIFSLFPGIIGKDLAVDCNGIHVQGFCYWTIKEKLPFNEANLKCGEPNGILAEIPNAEINQLISTHLTNDFNFTWIGVRLNEYNSYVDMYNVELTFMNFEKTYYMFNDDNVHKTHCVALKKKMVAERCTAFKTSLCSFPVQQNSLHCPSSMFAIQQKRLLCFRVESYYLDFWKAEEKCQESGGHLASIPDLETLELLATKFLTFSLLPNYDMWIGIHYNEENKTYVNMSNEIQTFTDWMDGEPSVPVRLYTSYVVLYKNKWYADKGKLSYPAVCSRRTACQGSELSKNTDMVLSYPIMVNYSEMPFDFGSEFIIQHSRGFETKLVCQKTGFWKKFHTTYQIIPDCLCPCSRIHRPPQNNMSSAVKKIIEIKHQLLLEKSELSSVKRKKISMTDTRSSAFALGSMLGVGVITVIILIILISDIPLLLSQIKLKDRQIKPK